MKHILSEYIVLQQKTRKVKFLETRLRLFASTKTIIFLAPE